MQVLKGKYRVITELILAAAFIYGKNCFVLIARITSRIKMNRLRPVMQMTKSVSVRKGRTRCFGNRRGHPDLSMRQSYCVFCKTQTTYVACQPSSITISHFCSIEAKVKSGFCTLGYIFLE